jgi:hypothetical protein
MVQEVNKTLTRRGSFFGKVVAMAALLEVPRDDSADTNIAIGHYFPSPCMWPSVT